MRLSKKLVTVFVVTLLTVGIARFLVADPYDRHVALQARCANVPLSGRDYNFCNSAAYDSVLDPYGSGNMVQRYRPLNIPAPASLCNEADSVLLNGSVAIRGTSVSCVDRAPNFSGGNSGYISDYIGGNNGFTNDSPCTIDIQSRCCRRPPARYVDSTPPNTPGRCTYDAARMFDGYAADGGSIYRAATLCSPDDATYPPQNCSGQTVRESRIIDNASGAASRCTLVPNYGFFRRGNDVYYNGSYYSTVPCTMNATTVCTVRDPYSCS